VKRKWNVEKPDKEAQKETTNEICTKQELQNLN